MNRRKFFSFLPIAPAAMMIDGARAVAKEEAPNDITTTISLSASKRKANYDPRILGYTYEKDITKTVSLSVGQDGNLWIKTENDKIWKRIITE